MKKLASYILIAAMPAAQLGRCGKVGKIVPMSL